jgi:hypothetical protein
VQAKIAFLSICVAAGAMGISKAACAQTADKLTEQNIRGFIEETTRITSGGNLESSPEEIIAYLERHLDEDAHFKTTIIYNVPGYPAQKSSLSVDKKDFIATIRQGSESVSDYSNDIKIKSIKISGDGKKSTVQTTGQETGVMPIPDENGVVQDVPIEGVSECAQIISLSKDGIIQMYNAICKTVVNFTLD